MKSHVLGFWLAGSNLLSLLSSNPTIAQIAADETLTRNTVIRQQRNVTVLEGGTTADGNLYHSFGSFSVPAGATAFFDNSLDIQNIISRVTGKSISNIDGLIRASGTANLFLINPAGIVFGQNARLDIGGSFIGSTADGIKFADGLEFSAINPQPTPQSDITATGANPQLNGTVQINTPDIDPTRGLIELPVEVADRSRLIAQACPIYKGNSFTITGSSGLPSSPREALRNNQTATVDWVSIAKNAEQARNVNSNNQQLIIKNLKHKISSSIIEANAWKVNKYGEVQLIASAPNLINTKSLVSACTSDNTVSSN